MELASYNSLIKHLPYKEQTFQTQRGTWTKYSKHPKFSKFYKKVFTSLSVAISRNDLFHAAKGDFSTAVYLIILWGYPRNMRGNSFLGVLENTQLLEGLIHYSQNLTLQEFENISKALKGTRIGLSTLTKIMYFFKITLNGYRCLILDSRILEVLKSGKFQELDTLKKIKEFNKDEYYPIYLKLMAEIAEGNEYTVDQLELFLFMFGNSLKTVDSLKITGGIHNSNKGTSY